MGKTTVKQKSWHTTHLPTLLKESRWDDAEPLVSKSLQPPLCAVLLIKDRWW